MTAGILHQPRGLNIFSCATKQGCCFVFNKYKSRFDYPDIRINDLSGPGRSRSVAGAMRPAREVKS